MGSNKLKTAAEAAGYAMVNPEDFAREPEPKPLISSKAPEAAARADIKGPARPPARRWPSLDLFGMIGKAPA